MPSLVALPPIQIKKARATCGKHLEDGHRLAMRKHREATETNTKALPPADRRHNMAPDRHC